VTYTTSLYTDAHLSRTRRDNRSLDEAKCPGADISTALYVVPILSPIDLQELTCLRSQEFRRSGGRDPVLVISMAGTAPARHPKGAVNPHIPLFWKISSLVLIENAALWSFRPVS
jgi:hypothetical protein